MRNRPRPEATKVEGSLAWKVFTRRSMLDLTQQKLAAKSRKLRPPGIGQSAIASIENGGTKWLRGPTLLALADGLEVNPYWLQSDDKDPTQRVQIGIDEGPVIDLLRSLTPTNLEKWISYGQYLASGQPCVRPSKHRPYLTEPRGAEREPKP